MKFKSPRLIVFVFLLVALAIFVDVPQSPGIHINWGSFIVNRGFSTHYGLDLVGGVQALLEADLPPNTPIDPQSMQTARAIVEKRVNGLGVSEAVVQQAGDRRILVELPGEQNPKAALETLQKTGLLEFVDFSMLSDQQALEMKDQTIQTDFGTNKTASPTVTGSETVADLQKQTYHTVMTGVDLKTATVQRDQAGNYQVAFTLSSNGTTIFKDFTSSHVGKALAIVLDKKVISAPRIDSAIPNGQGVISGNFTDVTANDLAVQLRYGSLPVPLKVISSQTVGPTLGATSLNKSFVAGGIGLAIVILFMILYYRLPGIVASLALLVYALVTLAMFKWIPVTLTLPGIAGFVLSVGVAVDANILIFERTKEELRDGFNLRQAIDLGWRRAWPSIRDSNISTLITCFILFWFGSIFGASIVKGFSLTLALGVGVSMFTAIVVTRMFLHLVLDNVDFVKHTKWFGV